MKLNDETVKKLEEAFSIGADIPPACYYANITKQTYYNWIKADKKLKEKFDRLREKPVLKAYQTVMKNMDKVETAKWFLERKRKKEFGNNIDITSDHEKIQVVEKINFITNGDNNQADNKTGASVE